MGLFGGSNKSNVNTTTNVSFSPEINMDTTELANATLENANVAAKAAAMNNINMKAQLENEKLSIFSSMQQDSKRNYQFLLGGLGVAAYLFFKNKKKG